MKKLSFLFIVLFSISQAQTLELTDGDYTYTKTITSGKQKKDLYIILKKWIMNNSSQYTLNKDDQRSGILSFEERLPLVHYNDSQSTIPSYTNIIEITNKQVIYRAEHIVFQDIFGGMTNTRNDYQSLLKKIALSVSTINQLKEQLNNERNIKNRFNLRKEISTENEKQSKLNNINTLLAEHFISNAEAIAKQINGTYQE
ncbi:hypothetical protein J2795_004656 [Chryseobacterium bernardetii]|jgi:hypothetical protein|uniref:Uncharacterized protein n=1 Tax=Chryseobacterium bernardetii TaxID=1241978 RepID=A0ACC6J1Y3_9FLAO|nr:MULTISPECIES: hypothetical protein [Chryseobacterium]MDR6373316.1 hypothetical protein [Chryseobacterium vietnamense]MDR6443903.1 hypothetical protein [Chryseobacterium bernardetii]